MLHLKILPNSEQNQSNFSKKILQKMMEKYTKKEIIFDEKYCFENIFYSTSHKKGISFVGISDTKIGIDIEIIKSRSEDFLDIFENREYEKLGGKNWENFYILWTAKEAIIKFANKNLDFIKDIKLEKSENFLKNFSEINFEKRLFFSNFQENFIVFSGKNG